jgi:putative two-component system response regulator
MPQVRVICADGDLMALAVSSVQAIDERSKRNGRKAAGPGGRPAPGSDFERALDLASLVETVSDAVIGVAPDGTITSWGDGAKRLFGYSPEEACGQPVGLLAPPDRTVEQETFLQRVLDGERIEQAETERVGKDGRTRQVLLSLAPIHDGQGELSGAVGIYRDLTDQREAERALRESERRYHSVVEALSEGVIMQEPDGSIVAFNKSVERILGLSGEEIESGSPEDTNWSLIREDGTELLVKEYPTIVALRTGEPQRGVVVGVEGPGLPTRWLSVNSSPLVAGDGSTPYAAVASFSDITELRATLAELQEARSEDLMRLALVSEYRDDDTNRHTERVGTAAELTALALGCDGDFAWTLRRAAPLHDVGKIGIPDQILLKPAALTPEESDVMKTHTTIGGRILCHSSAPVLQMATAIAFTHHERWDGAGYPAQIKGDAIPLAGRIVAVVDAFDAMTHDRPYRSARPIEQALAELERCSGAQFDPTVVAAFMTLDHVALVERS